MTKPCENGKKTPNFRLNLGPPKFLPWVLALLLVKFSKLSSMQFKGKPMNQTCENGKKSNFGPDFGLFWPKFGPQKFFW